MSHKKNRKPIRLPEYNYSQNGYYFVTICCRDKKSLFGKIVDKKMIPNSFGVEAEKYWKKIPEYHPHTKLGEYIVMPNHVHGIIIIKQPDIVGAQYLEPKKNEFQKTVSGSLGSIIRGYKSAVTMYAKKNGCIESPWQRNYHEHVIRSDEALKKISDYIKYNPQLWEKDKYFLEGSKY